MQEKHSGAAHIIDSMIANTTAIAYYQNSDYSPRPGICGTTTITYRQIIGPQLSDYAGMQ